MSKPLQRWADIPMDKRMTLDDLRSCRGAHNPDGSEAARWLERRIIVKCAAAIPMGGDWKKYTPCSRPVPIGSEFCWQHRRQELRKLGEASNQC